MNVLTESMEWSTVLLDRATTIPPVFRVGPSLIHRRTGRVEKPTGEERLRAKELELVAHLYEHAAITFTREELLQRVWNCQPGLMTRTVDQTVATLRKKIEADHEQHSFVQTVYGIGYQMVH